VYLSFFKLKDEPFRLTPDPRYLHLSDPHQYALTVVLEGIFYRKGLVMITGPIGTGKTTLIHTALQLFSDKKMPVKSALLFNPMLTRDEFLEMMLEEFEIKCTSTSKPRRLIALQQMLLDTQRRGGTAVLFIDEAHLLSPELLEEIRLLSNADMHQEKLLQIVISGQPELLALMDRPALSALKQRIAARAHLRPLNQKEMGVYVMERLYAAGLEGKSPFPLDAIEAIHHHSGGVPRLINLVCEGCLALGFRTQQALIRPDIVQEVSVSLGLVQAAPVVESKAVSSEAATAVPRAQRSVVDMLIESMKQNRAVARGANQNEQVF
jgi:general secretion pathway protein A